MGFYQERLVYDDRWAAKELATFSRSFCETDYKFRHALAQLMDELNGQFCRRDSEYSRLDHAWDTTLAYMTVFELNATGKTVEERLSASLGKYLSRIRRHYEYCMMSSSEIRSLRIPITMATTHPAKELRRSLETMYDLQRGDKARMLPLIERFLQTNGLAGEYRSYICKPTDHDLEILENFYDIIELKSMKFFVCGRYAFLVIRALYD